MNGKRKRNRIQHLWATLKSREHLLFLILFSFGGFQLQFVAQLRLNDENEKFISFFHPFICMNETKINSSPIFILISINLNVLKVGDGIWFNIGNLKSGLSNLIFHMNPR